ncbi:MAG: M20 family peptidase [Spirochaetaceae bacterium]
MIFYILITLLGLLLVSIIINTVRFKYKQLEFDILETESFDINRTAKKLSKAVQIPTISLMDRSLIDLSEFDKFKAMLKEEFPLCHKNMKLTIINEYSLLYRWKGENPESKPMLFMAHYDVVPIAEGTVEDWTFPPFSGEISDNYLWGRGSLDTKITLITSLESAELQLERGFSPKRDIYFAFGHDEEITGVEGAKYIVEYLKEQNIKFELILDEGGIVSTDNIKGLDKPVALIGIAEKGYADIEITIKGEGGHASMPPVSTSVGQMAKVITNLEKNQMPLKITTPVKLFLSTIGPRLGNLNRIILGNLWIFKPIFINIFSKTTSGNAMLRTTTAVTMAQGSNAANVLPQIAKATINYRITPGDSIDGVLKHIKNVNKSLNLDVKVLQGNEPSTISSIETEAYNTLSTIIKNVFEDVYITPYLVMARTDASFYGELSNSVYRFAPIVLSSSELSTIHNTNERVSLDNIERAVRFYIHLIKEL